MSGNIGAAMQDQFRQGATAPATAVSSKRFGDDPDISHFWYGVRDPGRLQRAEELLWPLADSELANYALAHADSLVAAALADATFELALGALNRKLTAEGMAPLADRDFTWLAVRLSILSDFLLACPAEGAMS